MFCQKCGNDVGESKFCPECGAKIEYVSNPVPSTPLIQDHPTKNTENKKKAKKGLKIFVSIILIISILILSYSVYFVVKHKKYQETATCYTDSCPYEVITFGKFEQDGDTSNGKEDIEWLVIERDGNYARVLSKYALMTWNPISDWTSSSLRTYLNDDFYYSAFSIYEQNRISYTNRKKNNMVISQDKVIIASQRNYGICKPTQALLHDGVYTDADGLHGIFRFLNYRYCYAVYYMYISDDTCEAVDPYGLARDVFRYIENIDYCVRPEMWIKLY